MLRYNLQSNLKGGTNKCVIYNGVLYFIQKTDEKIKMTFKYGEKININGKCNIICPSLKNEIAKYEYYIGKPMSKKHVTSYIRHLCKDINTNNKILAQKYVFMHNQLISMLDANHKQMPLLIKAKKFASNILHLQIYNKTSEYLVNDLIFKLISFHSSFTIKNTSSDIDIQTQRNTYKYVKRMYMRVLDTKCLINQKYPHMDMDLAKYYKVSMLFYKLLKIYSSDTEQQMKFDNLYDDPTSYITLTDLQLNLLFKISKKSKIFTKKTYTMSQCDISSAILLYCIYEQLQILNFIDFVYLLFAKPDNHMRAYNIVRWGYYFNNQTKYQKIYKHLLQYFNFSQKMLQKLTQNRIQNKIFLNKFNTLQKLSDHLQTLTTGSEKRTSEYMLTLL